MEWLADGYGHGLMLAMKPSGAKSWVQRIVVKGRRRAMGLGSFELVTLAEARDAAFANRRIARRDGDPFEDRRRPSAPTFAEAAAPDFDVDADLILRWLAGIVEPGVTPQRSRELKRLVDRQLAKEAELAAQTRRETRATPRPMKLP